MYIVWSFLKLALFEQYMYCNTTAANNKDLLRFCYALFAAIKKAPAVAGTPAGACLVSSGGAKLRAY